MPSTGGVVSGLGISPFGEKRKNKMAHEHKYTLDCDISFAKAYAYCDCNDELEHTEIESRLNQYQKAVRLLRKVCNSILDDYEIYEEIQTFLETQDAE